MKKNPVLSESSFAKTTTTQLSNKLGDLGVTLDKELNQAENVNEISKEKATFVITSVARMRRFL